MKNEVGNDFGNQVPNPMEPTFTESNVQPTIVPESPQPMTPEPMVGATTIENNLPNGNKTSKLFSKNVGPIVAVSIVLVLIIAAIIFLGVSASPKNVFKGSINKVFKEAENAIDLYDEYSKAYDIQKNAILVNFDAELETNVKELEDKIGFNANGLSFGAKLGFDLKNEALSLDAEVKGEKEKLDATLQIIKEKLYVESSLFDKVLYINEDLNIDFESIKEEIEEAEEEFQFEPEDYKYVVKTLKNALNKSLSSEDMKKDKDEFSVGDKTIKVTKYSYVLDKKATRKLAENVIDYLLDDKDFVKKVAEITGMEKSEIKDELKDAKDELKDIDFEDEISINIYTKGLFNSAVGFGIEYDGKEYLTYVVDGKNAKFILDNHSDGYDKTKVVITIEEDGKEQALTVKYNDQKIVTGTIKELTEEVIDMTLEVDADGEKIKAHIYLSATEKDKNISGKYELKVELEDKYVGIKGNYGISTAKELELVNTKNAVNAEEYDFTKVEEELEKRVKNDSVLQGIYDLAEKENIVNNTEAKLNYNNMVEKEMEDMAGILTSTTPKVLYVGEDYYSYTEADASSMLANLISVQSELNFNSYFLDTYFITDMSGFETLVQGVQYTCNTTTANTACENYPAIYLIKDGKVQKAYRGTVSTDELKKSIQELGI
ncbi:MAG: hypothetical protein ACI4XM_00540 [Candidatus Coprovivens sp.]